MKITKNDLKSIIKSIIEENRVVEEQEISKAASNYVREASKIFQKLDDVIFNASSSENNLNESDYAYFKDMVQSLIKQIDL